MKRTCFISISRSLILFFPTLLLSCSLSNREAADRLNDKAYACHYRNLDSTDYYARQACSAATQAADVRAEALNHQAFVSLIRMQYDKAASQLDTIPQITDNQLELLVCYVQQMRLCQRRSQNREFYDYSEKAQQALKRINEERHLLTNRQRARLLYAESELAIVTSTYYYYVGLEQQSIDALYSIPADIENDTAQWLNYLYNIGAGGIITEGAQADISQQEFDLLLRCYQKAQQHNYPYFAANALEAMAEHLMDQESRDYLMAGHAADIKLINPEGVADNELPVWLAEKALDTFREYGDVYQIAGAYRTLASCYRAQGDYESALYNLEQSLADSTINQAPDLVASIREQLSVAYAAINDKQLSDANRNNYLDLQEQTRQDRYLEARANQLDRTVGQLNQLIAAVVAAIVLLVFLLWLFSHLNKRQRKHEQLDELLEEKQEQLALSRLHIEKSERINLEQRAKLSLVNSITPLIDRMLYAIGHLSTTDAQWSMDYIHEITDQINADNEVLTQWIQLRQGELSLHIESFALQPLFDIVARGRMGFQMKGITLDVAPTTATVKADRILTLFMLNTLADNARKFTPEGGTVNITATETTDYVEVSVADTGIGMSEAQLEHVFDRTVISDDNAQPSSHGFGLLNCKGIIEKYRKLSHIFTVCTLQAESTEGKGSRFFFRLPKGVVRLLLILFSIHFPLSAIGSQTSSPLHRASIYADSAYFSNINGTYERTLLFADSCRECLNACYQELRPNGNVLMQAVGDLSVVAPEIQWFHDSLNINYNIILDIRNESAVAALALHEWQLYAYNNRIYTMLFKEMSADNTLSEYCRSMQQSQNNKTIAVILLVLVLLAIVPAYYFLYLRHRLAERYQAERLRRDSVDALDDEIRRADMEQAALHVSNAVLDNCLSALKHETMYYPSRIQQLISQPDSQSDGGALAEVTAYYRDLYSLLSQQAMRQTEHTKLHLTTLDDQVLGDDNLIRYLFEILRKQSGGQRLQKTVRPIGDNYVEVTVDMPQLRLTHEQAALLFTPSVANIPYLLCRQIVRDHGEATNRRACSIRAEVSDDGKTLVRIVLPGAMRRA